MNRKITQKFRNDANVRELKNRTKDFKYLHNYSLNANEIELLVVEINCQCFSKINQILQIFDQFFILSTIKKNKKSERSHTKIVRVSVGCTSHGVNSFFFRVVSHSSATRRGVRKLWINKGYTKIQGLQF